jgi:hypothetical protein
VGVPASPSGSRASHGAASVSTADAASIPNADSDDWLATIKSTYAEGVRQGRIEGFDAAGEILRDVQQTLGELALRVAMARERLVAQSERTGA